jgi:PKD repeat protein
MLKQLFIISVFVLNTCVTFAGISFNNNVLSSTVSPSYSVNTIVAYEYWFNNSYGQKVYQTVTPSAAINISTSIATGSIGPGVHSFNIRYKDQYNNWSMVNSDLFYKPFPSSSQSGNNMVAYEYWFDNGYAQKVFQTIGPTQAFVLNTSIGSGTISPGVHSFNIRFKDSYNRWSIVESSLFYKPFPSSSQSGNNMVAYEYWFDNGYAQKVSQTLTPSQAIVLNTSINTGTMSSGVHSFNIRFKDSYNRWSIVESSLFYKPFPSQNQNGNAIIAYEYWFNNNYAQKITASLTPAQAQVLNTSINTGSIASGVHSFNIRFKDSFNNWSVVQSSMFYKAGTNATLASNKINAYRYWIDTLISARTTVTLSAPVPAMFLNAPLTMTNIPKGKHLFNIQFRDSVNHWSIVQADSFMKNSLPIASFTVNSNVFCNSGVVNFTNTSIDGDVYNWNFGDNSTSTLSSVSHTYNTIGNYTVSLQITDTVTQISSTFTLPVIISGQPVFSLGADTLVCPNSNFSLTAIGSQSLYLWNTGSVAGSIVTTTLGIYWCEVTNNYGCTWRDSVTIGHKALPQAQFNSSVNGLQVSFSNSSGNATGYSWNFGDAGTSTAVNPVHTYTLPGSYTVTLVATNSCSSDTVTQIVSVSDVGVQQLSGSNKVYVFPNPNRGEFELYIEMPDEGETRIALYAADGRLVDEWTGDIGTKIFRKNYDVNHLDNGVYHLVISNARNKAVKKIIVAR